ncbi:hypothetical protein Dimus_037944 [Dionaea muscipula]
MCGLSFGRDKEKPSRSNPSLPLTSTLLSVSSPPRIKRRGSKEKRNSTVKNQTTKSTINKPSKQRRQGREISLKIREEEKKRERKSLSDISQGDEEDTAWRNNQARVKAKGHITRQNALPEVIKGHEK